MMRWLVLKPRQGNVVFHSYGALGQHALIIFTVVFIVPPPFLLATIPLGSVYSVCIEGCQ